jgi:hypothetical protein
MTLQSHWQFWFFDTALPQTVAQVTDSIPRVLLDHETTEPGPSDNQALQRRPSDCSSHLSEPTAVNAYSRCLGSYLSLIFSSLA